MPLASFESGGLSIEHGICVLFQTRSSRTANCLLVFIFCHLYRLFQGSVGNTRFTRAGDKREAQKGMMGTSVDREQGVMGRKMRERAFSPLPITPFVQAFLNN